MILGTSGQKLLAGHLKVYTDNCVAVAWNANCILKSGGERGIRTLVRD